MRVTFIQNMVVPYEHPLFSALAGLEEIELTVYFCSGQNRSTDWGISGTSGYRGSILSGFTIPFHGIEMSFNPSILHCLKLNPPDVIVLSGGYQHPTMMLAFIFAHINGIPVVYRSDENSASRSVSAPQDKIASFLLETLMARNSQALVCPGKMAKEYHARMGIDPRRIFISPYTTAADDRFLMGCRDLRIHKDETKRQLGLNEKIIILYVGRLLKTKSPDILLRAFEKLSSKVTDVGLVFVGRGPLERDMREYCRSRKLANIHFVEPLFKDKLLEMYSVSNVLVLPSVVERWGLVVNEAMLCGLPVILSKSVGASEMVIEGVNGFTTEAGNEAQLVSALYKIVSDTERAITMGDEASRTVREEFNIQRRLSGFVEALRFATRTTYAIGNGKEEGIL
jgi:glycosyltransferase involved in cell wall biosynthesis